MLLPRVAPFVLLVTFGCSTDDANVPTDAGSGGVDAPSEPTCTGTRTECAASWEQAASARFDAVLTDPAALAGFLMDVPKGGDLHNHLTGAVYAETLLDWAMADGTCINTTTAAATSSCATGTQPAPTSGAFFDTIVRAWSMEDFVPGAESGHDHFFATFGKFGIVAGAHRDETIADVLTRAASENQVYVETMFNLGTNVGSLSASVWSGQLTAADLPTLYDQLIAAPGFAMAVTNDVDVVTRAKTGYRAALGCDDLSAPPACEVGVRFIAQVSRTSPNDQVFGQLIGAYEMASRTPQIVAANLSSPEDAAASIANYNLHMAMLEFLRTKYAATSPLHITLHAGELTAEYLPPNSTANTFHIRSAVEIAQAERIGHGLDIMSETNPSALMDDMAARKVLVEVCLSSNIQILEVAGTDHPLAQYLAHGVPVALATDDQGVSRSSMAGEYMRAAIDQKLTYRQLKTLARNSLEYAFLPGATLASLADCTPTAEMAAGDPPSASCMTALDGSERARTQWELERRFLAFESQQ